MDIGGCRVAFATENSKVLVVYSIKEQPVLLIRYWETPYIQTVCLNIESTMNDCVYHLLDHVNSH